MHFKRKKKYYLCLALKISHLCHLYDNNNKNHPKNKEIYGGGKNDLINSGGIKDILIKWMVIVFF